MINMSLQNTSAEKPLCKNRQDDSRLLQFANENRKGGHFNDVTIKVGSDYLPANRMVLSCYSSFFETMFKSEMKESYENTVEIQSVDEKTMKILIEYIYTGEIVIEKENVTQLLSAADYLLIDQVKEYCFEYLESIITPPNCFDILKAGNLYGNNSLKSKAYQVIEEDFIDVVQTTSFKQLACQEIISFISKLNRSKIEETSLYEGIITWIQHDEETRKNEFQDLFQLLNLDKFTLQYLNDVVVENEIVKENNVIFHLVLKNWFGRIKESKKDGEDCQKEECSKILSLGGSNCDSKVIQVHKKIDATLKSYPDLPTQLQDLCALNVNNTVYCIGGRARGDDRNRATNEVWQMDLNENPLQWKRIQSLNVAREEMGAAVYKNVLVVAGGNDEEGRVLSSTEIHSKQIDEWKTIAPLQHKRRGNALVACQDCLYAIGGCDENLKSLSSVERLDGLKEKWKFVSPMQTPRSWFAAVNCNGCIYAIGGHTGSFISKTVEKFDPDTEEWVYVSDMNIQRHGHAACVLENKIYVVGGMTGSYNSVKAIECYVPSCDEWSIVGEIEEILIYHSLVIV